MLQLFDALASDPAQLIRSTLRVLHFIGLAIGVGAATLLDMMVLRYFLGQNITTPVLEVFLFLSRFVTGGLILLWITGAGFLIFYWYTDPALLMNEKIWAKMAIVAILTINGRIIHKLALPFIGAQLGKTMFDGVPTRRRSVFVIMANVSLVSWYAPVFIANLPQLNFTVPMTQILVGYALGLAAVIAVAHLVLFGRRLGRAEADASSRKRKGFPV